MSVFGGDSWEREAQQRKRRVEDLVVDGLRESSSCSSSPSFKKLSNGKYACLVCPHNPILDSPLILSMHCKGSRHCVSESKLKERELRRENEIKKRIALSLDCSNATSSSHATSSTHKVGLRSGPLIEQTHKVTSAILCNKITHETAANKNCDVRSGGIHCLSQQSKVHKNMGFSATEAVGKVVAQQQLDFRERRERELKFTAAGWKRDCHGKWFKDENVEFDSDEEDPNECLM